MCAAAPNPIGEGRPVWDDTAPRHDIAALDPGLPDALPGTPDVLVVGGGQVGLATAAACTSAGMSTLLVERGRLAGGPSGRNGGFLLVDLARSWPEVWRRLSRRSLELHREFNARADFGLRLLDLAAGEEVIIAAQGHVNPLRAAAAYARSAGVVATGIEGLGLDRGFFRTTHGDITPGAVVFATGCCSRHAGDVRQDYVKGHVLATEGAPFSLDRILVDGEVGVVQLEDGRLVCGGTKDYDDVTTPVVDATVSRLRDAMTAMVPDAAELEISHSWTCFRPRVADEFPVIDRVADNVFVAGGLYSTGVLMAPVVGETIARWIADGKRPDGIEAFASAREALQAAQAPVPTGERRPRA
jgi:glycine/D-amino acid oxidase-like deaminating enzyme